ncbi:hypothetical protein HZH68_000347 [Vespula germanica]|uniref:Uncharacterized protein n=1 Tax=Vespula germanica TaxID=30212 RepID=A0A834U5N7_VESGE|nr:hypothetical protein HZH68_000347 [Vespula germanica]
MPHDYLIGSVNKERDIVSKRNERRGIREQACTISPHWSKDSYGYVGQTTMATPILVNNNDTTCVFIFILVLIVNYLFLLLPLFLSLFAITVSSHLLLLHPKFVEVEEEEDKEEQEEEEEGEEEEVVVEEEEEEEEEDTNR